MELSVQLIGEFDDETEDMLQDCPIYTELVGMRNTTKMTYHLDRCGSGRGHRGGPAVPVLLQEDTDTQCQQIHNAWSRQNL